MRGEGLQSTKDELVQGLLDDNVRKDVLDKLDCLPREQIDTLRAACRSDDGKCDANAVAFLVRECGGFTHEDVGTFAQYLDSYFLDRIKKLKDVPLDRSHPECLDREAVLKGIALWYEEVGYEIKDGETLKVALAYAFFSDERPCTEKSRAGILLEAANRRESKVLSEYWVEQPASRQLDVYRNGLRDPIYGVLPILQPVIFDRTCVRNGGCTEEDYMSAFKSYVTSVIHPDKLEFFLEGSLFSELVEVLCRMTGRAAVENLGLDKWALLPFLPAGLELPKELVLKMATFGSDTPMGHADYVILDPKVKETWEVLENQLWVQLGPKYTKFVKSYRYFPHERVARYIPEQYRTLIEYTGVYEAAATDIRQRLLRIKSKLSWTWIESNLAELFSVDTFWQLLSFLEDNLPYGGLFGAMILRNASARMGPGDELGPGGWRGLIQEAITDPDKESCREKLDSITAHFIKISLGGDHPYSEDRFKLVREQFSRDLSAIFENSVRVVASFDEYILRIPAEADKPDGLHDLQVALVAKRALNGYDGPEEDLQILERTMRKYNTGQLENIYKSGFEVYPLFKHSQLREFEPDLFQFKQPVGRKQVFALLSKIYQQAHPGRKSIFGLILDALGQELESERHFFSVSRLISGALGTLPRDQDFLSDSDGLWLELERGIYADLCVDTIVYLTRRLGPKLTTEPLKIDEAIDTKLYRTFDELLEGMVKLGRGFNVFTGHA